MTDTVTVTLPIVTVGDVAMPRWMTPFAKHLFAIPTHMTVSERLALFQTALNLQPEFTVVEIGSYLGASTAFLGFAALQRNGNVHAIDGWTNEANGPEGARDTFGEFKRNTLPFEHFISPHRGYSTVIYRSEGAIPCEMLFIDGDHSYNAVVADLNDWLPSLTPGGVLAMHDIDQPDVRRAFDEIVAPRLTKPPQVLDRLLICWPTPAV
jgi:predicted O-methyltransferase YrrM